MTVDAVPGAPAAKKPRLEAVGQGVKEQDASSTRDGNSSPNSSLNSESAERGESPVRDLCSLGTGEIVHILAFQAEDPDKVNGFERTIQTIGRDLYNLTAGITDIRVCHPQRGQVVFVITFLGRRELDEFRSGPERKIKKALDKFVDNSVSSPSADDDNNNTVACTQIRLTKEPEKPPPRDKAGSKPAKLAMSSPRLRSLPDPHQVFSVASELGSTRPLFEATGTLMPCAHTMESLLSYFKANITGYCHQDHCVKAVADECEKWYPRLEEYQKYIHWDEHDPKKYTRNLIYRNEYFDCLLMCWPPHCESAIHCHDRSSCWVVLVQGEVWEIQYATPQLDKKFLKSELKNPTGAIGRCGPLRKTKESCLSGRGNTTAYANNDIGVHKVENRTSKPAYTLHVYAPGLRKIKIFQPAGDVWIHTVGALQVTSEGGERTGLWGENTDPDGVLDVAAWNAAGTA